MTTKSKDMEDEITEIFETLRMSVYYYLLAVFGDPPEAEDLTQETFLRLFKDLERGKSIRNVRFWIFRVAHNMAINRRKHSQFISSFEASSWDDIEQQLRAPELNPEQEVLQREKFERLYKRVKKLSLKERQTLNLRAEGFRYKEIAKIMNVALPTVGEYLQRGIKKLAEKHRD